MTTTLPASDLYDQGVALLTHPLEYLRGNVAGSFLDADPHLVYDAGDGFARFEDGAATLALYRRVTVDATRAKIRFQHKRVGGSAGAVRYTGLLLRARPTTLTASATTGQTDYADGLASAYLVQVADNNSTVSVSVYRVVSGSPSLLGVTTVAAAENTWHTLEARIQTNAATNVEIVVLFNGTPLTGMQPLTDTNAARVLTAGAVGLQGTSVNAGGEEVRTLFDYFQIVTFDGATTVLEDDFQRPDPVLTTAGGKVHASLAWEFGDAQQISGATGSTKAPGYQGNMLAIDPGNPSAGFIGPWIDLYQRTPAGNDQTAGIRFRFDGTSAAALHSVGVVLRGAKSAAGTGTGNFTGYVLRARMASGGTAGIVIERYNAGTPTVLASRNWIFQPDKWYQFEVSGTVSGSNYVLKVNLGIATALQVTDTSPLGPTGLLGIYGRMNYANGSAGTLLIDKWYASTFPAPGAIVAAPVFTVTEELDVPHEYLEDQVKEWAQVRFPFESGHAQTYPALRQAVTVWSAEWLCEEPDASTVYDFLVARCADAVPFLIHASTGDKEMFLVSQEIPFAAVQKGLYRIGPVEMVEYIPPDSTP